MSAAVCRRIVASVEIRFGIDYRIRFLTCGSAIEVDQLFAIANSPIKYRKIFTDDARV